MSLVLDIKKRYPGFMLDMQLEAGEERVALLGASGCGKSCTLRCIAGVEMPDEGKIVVSGVTFFDSATGINLSPQERKCALLFQNYQLFPNMTVADNVCAGVKDAGDAAARKKLAERYLGIFGLADFADRYPARLSGGQQQRVALARALVIEPSVLLFDEPLSNLDAKLRVSMRTEIRRIQQEVGITAIYVTHDQSEAMALSDQIIIMNKGVVAQIGTPQEIYYHPVSEFVADFIGEANFLRGKMTGTENGLAVLDVEGERLAVAPREGMRVGEEYTVVLRPESAALSDEGGLPCTVELSCFMGSYQNYHVRVGNTLVKLAENDPRNKRIFRVGEQCHLTFAPDAVHVL